MFWLKPIAWIALICLVPLAVGYKDYKDYKIYNVVASTEEQQQQLGELAKDSSLDFFELGRSLNRPWRVLVPPAKTAQFVEQLDKHGIEHALQVADVAEVIAAERRANRAPYRTLPRAGRTEILERYFRYEEINEHLDELARLHPSRVFVKSVGRSYERRMIQAITITNGDGRTGKKVIFLNGGLHAREWISPAMALYIVHELVENLAANSHLLQDYDWIVVPLANPDGYEYTHEEDRLWRKTRRPSDLETTGCYGIDPNRNFGYEWGLDVGSSNDPCSNSYRGERAFSEYETQVIRDIMLSYGERCKFYLDVHSYGNYLLVPWGYTSDLPDNFDDMMEVAEAGAMALLHEAGAIYSYGSSYIVIYPTSGDSTDYAVGTANVSVAMTMELPGGGANGFDPPADEIADIVRESWIGVKAMAEVVVTKY